LGHGREMYFQFEKIQPYLAEFREKMRLPGFLKSIETVVVGAQERRARVPKVKSPKQAGKVRAQAVDADDSAAVDADSPVPSR